MNLRRLISPINEVKPENGPIENSFISSFHLTDKQIREYEGMSLLTSNDVPQKENKRENRSSNDNRK